MQFDAGSFLQVADHAEQVASLRIAPRAEHADQTLGLRTGRFAELLEADRCFDVTAQDRFAGVDVASEHRVDALAQHGEVDDLLGRIQDSDNASERGQLFSEMTGKLLPHLKAEQEVLYIRLASGKSQVSRQFGIEGTSEHTHVERQVQKLAGITDRMSDAWSGELKVLQDLIEHHVGEEESTGFSCARDEFEKSELEAMSREFQARKAHLASVV
jgi:hypothetical protein